LVDMQRKDETNDDRINNYGVVISEGVLSVESARVSARCVLVPI